MSGSVAVGKLSPQQEDAVRKVRNLIPYYEAANTVHSKPMHRLAVTSVKFAASYNTQLKDLLPDIEYLRDKDDYYFLRWLRAKKFNVLEAKDMLRMVSSYVPLLKTPSTLTLSKPSTLRRGRSMAWTPS